MTIFMDQVRFFWMYWISLWISYVFYEIIRSLKANYSWQSFSFKEKSLYFSRRILSPYTSLFVMYVYVLVSQYRYD